MSAGTLTQSMELQRSFQTAKGESSDHCSIEGVYRETEQTEDECRDWKNDSTIMCAVFRSEMSRRSVPGAGVDALDEVIRVRVNIEWRGGGRGRGSTLVHYS